MADRGVPGVDAVGEPTDATGVMGFMCSPLMTARAGSLGGSADLGVANFGVPTGERGGGAGRTFSR